MTSTPIFNPARLATARERRAITKSALTQSLALSSARFHQIELGNFVPDTDLVRSLANELNFPVAFFYGDDLLEVPTEGAHFRAPLSISKRRKAQIRAITQIAMHFRIWLETRFILPEVAIPCYPDWYPEQAAAVVRRDWDLGVLPIGDMVALLEAHGAIVLGLPQDCREIDAFSFWCDGYPYIFLNTQKSPERTRFDIAHELGHLVQHTRERTGDKDRENEAMQFAAAFLMPRESVLPHAVGIHSIRQVIQAKHIWRVSTTALTRRLHDLGLVNTTTYQDWSIRQSRLGYRTQEPEPTFPDLSQLLQNVLGFLRQDNISLADIADELAIPRTDLTDFVAGLTPPLTLRPNTGAEPLSERASP